ncbi:DUF3710 domain-containing protein [Nocardiopsis sp. HNM0947]|uniref:DUF3710 domain-containing protein n=1 Tax=Nocardiopsis coralli TaxID=2772213 RepID=A0ABR9P6W0_9ACTN|nr:DUF3710 domain-containing protein [Nocardiopsis coralli]MBE2999595.1 DUF3710 domain-containing protein [Nocardiopsis coralli]
MFGRRKKKDQETDRGAAPESGSSPVKKEGAAGAVSFDNEITPEAPKAQPAKDVDRHRATGPWDESEDAPEANRMDLGSMQVPMEQGTDIQVNVAQDKQGKQRVIGITLVRGRTSLQVQPFAAPKSSGLWDEMREELRGQVTQQGGRVEDHEGPFGAELRALVPVKGRTNEEGKQMGQRVRFIGVDGPRWVLRGVVRGEGASKPEMMAEAERMFAGIVVARGDQPAPPSEMLPIVVPKEIQDKMSEAAKQRAAQKGNAGRSPNGSPESGSAGEQPPST